MDETYYAGAYWSGRVEPMGAYARRAELFFQHLMPLDPSFATWFEQASSKAKARESQFLPSAEAFLGLFKKKKYRLGEREVSFAAWNGESEASSVVNFSCGSPSPRTTDLCVLRPPARGSAAERLISSSGLERVLRAMALAWEPEFGIATSHAHRDGVLKLQDAGTFVGWVMYFSHQRGVVPPLPAPVRIESIAGKGTLVVLTPERFSAREPRHVELAAHVQEVLAGVGLLKPVRFVSS